MRTIYFHTLYSAGTLLRPLALAPLLLLGACASFSGIPEPVLPADAAVQMTRTYPIGTALAQYHGSTDAARNGMSQRQWRDMIVGIYMAAADARYHEFRASLSRESRGSNFGLNSAVLGLSGAGTVAGGGTANVLAAITGALSGSQSALSRDVFFERTLPALVASMEAGRLEVATRIHTGLTQDIADYPLERAITDALAYERAASLDQAVQRVTVGAAVDAANQQAAFQRIDRVSATVAAPNRPLLRQVTDEITGLFNRQATDPQAAQEFQKVMTAFGVDTTQSPSDQTQAAIDKAVELASQGDALATLVADLKTSQGVDLSQ